MSGTPSSMLMHTDVPPPYSPRSNISAAMPDPSSCRFSFKTMKALKQDVEGL
jgi:hypothetical protein